MSNVIPLTVPCPGCMGEGIARKHVGLCASRWGAECDCQRGSVTCPCCCGARRVSPVVRNWWLADLEAWKHEEGGHA